MFEILQKVKVVDIYKSLEKLWTSKIDIIIYEPFVLGDSKITKYKEKVLHKDIPCKVSYRGLGTTKDLGVANALEVGFEVTKRVKIFLSKDIDIPEGSKIVLKQGDKTFVYERSGSPSFFTYHQEVYIEMSSKV